MQWSARRCARVTLGDYVWCLAALSRTAPRSEGETGVFTPERGDIGNGDRVGGPGRGGGRGGGGAADPPSRRRPGGCGDRGHTGARRGRRQPPRRSHARRNRGGARREADGGRAARGAASRQGSVAL